MLAWLQEAAHGQTASVALAATTKMHTKLWSVHGRPLPNVTSARMCMYTESVLVGKRSH